MFLTLLLPTIMHISFEFRFKNNLNLIYKNMIMILIAMWCLLSNLVPQFLALVSCHTWSRHLCNLSAVAMLCLLGSDGLWDYVQIVMSYIFGTNFLLPKKRPMIALLRNPMIPRTHQVWLYERRSKDREVWIWLDIRISKIKHLLIDARGHIVVGCFRSWAYYFYALREIKVKENTIN